MSHQGEEVQGNHAVIFIKLTTSKLLCSAHRERIREEIGPVDTPWIIPRIPQRLNGTASTISIMTNSLKNGGSLTYRGSL
ncbi:hypothetical protein I7I50_00221 [Histoplasma capsulatum G186AR]|uniref:Uncharacterized protein n=1 Tax=Ajellomyces capsulatus TaxID=5037 RepID=A0A8H8CVM9_AJECA|nr:hypothetical protein I7I52_07490 [Histoplasma capsulatum]QSS72391.1 hypothetical protein I7I50_00221 [Histoplasma capsulatum G186AR]